MQLKLKIGRTIRENAFWVGVSILVTESKWIVGRVIIGLMCVCVCIPSAYKDGVSKLRYAWFI